MSPLHVCLAVAILWFVSGVLSSSVISAPLQAVEYRRNTAWFACISCEANDLAKRAAEIEQNGSDVSYYVDIQLGDESNSNYSLVVDTGSYDLWVYSTSCSNLSCTDHNRYGPENSTTLEVFEDQSFSITYGQGVVSGVTAQDFVALSGFNISMKFGLAENVADSFNSFPIDGTIGLAASQVQLNGYPSFLTELDSDNLISRQVFAIDLGRSEDKEAGSITFGGVDTSRYTGDINFADVVNLQGLWVIGIDDCYVNGVSESFEGKLALIDTGTTLLLLPPDDALQIHQDLVGNGNVVLTDGSNFVIPCNTSTKLAISFGGVQWEMESSDYIGRTFDDAGNCVSNIEGTSVNGTSTWLIGASFLKGVYTVFDRDSMRVGFAARGTGGVDAYASASSSSSSETSTRTSKVISSTESPVTVSKESSVSLVLSTIIATNTSTSSVLSSAFTTSVATVLTSSTLSRTTSSLIKSSSGITQSVYTSSLPVIGNWSSESLVSTTTPATKRPSASFTTSSSFSQLTVASSALASSSAAASASSTSTSAASALEILNIYKASLALVTTLICSVLF